MKTYKYIINSIEYVVTIQDNIMKITCGSDTICDNIGIADGYISNEDLIKSIAELQVEDNKKLQDTEVLIADALKKISMSKESK